MDIDTLDYEHYLPLFLDGLCETQHPHEFLARKGAEDLIMRAPDRVTPLLPVVIPPLRSEFQLHNVVSGMFLCFASLYKRRDFSRLASRSAEHAESSRDLFNTENYSTDSHVFERVGTGVFALLQVAFADAQPVQIA